MSTIRSPIVPIKPNEDSLNIHRALRGLIYDAGAIIDILAYRNAVQRSQIIVVYKNMFEEDLCKVIKSKLHFHFKKAVLMWMRDPFERDARILRKALRANRSSQRSYVLAEVFSTKSSDDLLSTAKSYHSLYKRSLQTDIEASLSGSCQKLFMQYLVRNKSHAVDLEQHVAEEKANMLHKLVSTDINETSLIETLTSDDPRQLCRVLDAYKSMYGRDISEVFEENSKKGNTEFCKTVGIIFRCLSCSENYFAKVLYKSMKGTGTDDDTLIRIIVTHAETDLAHIKAAFVQRYKVSLSSMIRSDTTYKYRKFLLALVGEDS
ncbi:hypothetical protein KP509_17G035300 [Ceratopteris richardii]|uniref:Annexin n=2 Tax=Ceratopteris richardii TaxID=49495 RepID=A0A8T2SXE8_CERRI|nr:hypothetical protein KP509_17G035300 [Ceratopteris richardii]